MKHSKLHKTPLTDIQRLARRVKDYRLPSGPFDYAIRAQSVNDVRKFFYEITRDSRYSYTDPEANSVIEAARRLYFAALDAACPAEFWEDCQKLRAGNPAGLESAVSFLEADPFFFRSGYVKEWLIRCIKPPMLSPTFAARLQGVVLNIVDRRDGREFRAYCRLARKVDAPRLQEKLARRLTFSDPNVQRRAQWVLKALEQKDGAGKPPGPQ